jgi:hypothetical protein
MSKPTASLARRAGVLVGVALAVVFLGVVMLGAGRAEASPASQPASASVPSTWGSTGSASSTAAPSPTAQTTPSPATTSPTTPPTGGSSTPPGIQVGPTLPGSTPTTSPGTNVPAGAGSSFGFFDVTCHVTSAINSWFRDLVTSALNPILGLLGRTVLVTPDITGGKVAEL